MSSESVSRKIAWVGPVGDAGVPGIGRMLLTSLVEAGVSVDLYHAGAPETLPNSIRQHAKVGLRVIPIRWEWGRWYSRNRLLALPTSLIARAFAHRQLMRDLIRRAPGAGYDAILQFSQPESFGLDHSALSIPRYIHPCSHAAGELRWHRRESRYARQSEGTLGHYAVRLILVARSIKQRRDMAHADVLVGPSEVFVSQVILDYHLTSLATAVLRHPIDTEAFQPDDSLRDPSRKLRLLYISRISSRKGVESIVSLSQRIADLCDRVHIDIIGAHDLSSDYSAHLAELDPGVASYLGPVGPAEVKQVLRSGDALLVPSMYEPGSIVFGEALASGIPIIASDAVGPTEVVNPVCCRVFPAGDIPEFENAVRRLVAELPTRWPEITSLCRQEALKHFSADVVGSSLIRILYGSDQFEAGYSPNGEADAALP